jgi:hypothetical protein
MFIYVMIILSVPKFTIGVSLCVKSESQFLFASICNQLVTFCKFCLIFLEQLNDFYLFIYLPFYLGHVKVSPFVMSCVLHLYGLNYNICYNQIEKTFSFAANLIYK